MIVFGTALESKRHSQDDSAVLLRCCRVGEGRGVKGRYEKSQVAGQEYTELRCIGIPLVAVLL